MSSYLILYQQVIKKSSNYIFLESM